MKARAIVVALSLVVSLAGCGKEAGASRSRARGRPAPRSRSTPARSTSGPTSPSSTRATPPSSTRSILKQGGASVGTATCNPLGHMSVKTSWVETNLGGSHSRKGNGKMACSGNLAKGGDTTVKAHLAFGKKPATAVAHQGGSRGEAVIPAETPQNPPVHRQHLPAHVPVVQRQPHDRLRRLRRRPIPPERRQARNPPAPSPAAHVKFPFQHPQRHRVDPHTARPSSGGTASPAAGLFPGSRREVDGERQRLRPVERSHQHHVPLAGGGEARRQRLANEEGSAAVDGHGVVPVREGEIAERPAAWRRRRAVHEHGGQRPPRRVSARGANRLRGAQVHCLRARPGLCSQGERPLHRAVG